MSHRLNFLRTVYRSMPYPVQNAAVSYFGRKRWVHENRKCFQVLVQKLQKMQYSEHHQIVSYMRDRLGNILLAAKKTDFYKKTLPSPEDILRDPTSVLKSIPVLDRKQIRIDFESFINHEYEGKLIQHGTSGTTGTPVQIMWTEDCIDWERALIWRQRLETGLRYGDEWRGMLGGHQIVPLEQNKPPFWRISRKAKQIYLSTYHLSPETAPAYYQALKKFQVEAIEGYPSVLYALAYSLDRRGLSFPLKGVYYGAEPLLDFQREVIERVFSCYVWDYYGLTERVASASEFSCKNGLHENWENCYLEIIDHAGNAVPEGEYGELVGTSLSNLAFPLLRYRTGDMTRFLPGECSCGRSSRRIARIDTKREDILLMPDGSLLSASNLTFPFKEVEHILESQLFQQVSEELEVRVVPAEGYLESDGDKLISGIRQMVPDSVAVVLKKVSEIPRTKSGKFRFCISEITHPKKS